MQGKRSDEGTNGIETGVGEDKVVERHEAGIKESLKFGVGSREFLLKRVGIDLCPVTLWGSERKGESYRGANLFNGTNESRHESNDNRRILADGIVTLERMPGLGMGDTGTSE